MGNKHEEQKFKTQLGQAATVQRTVEASADNAILNEKLFEIGEALHPLKNSPGTVHLGSAAVHIYYNETVKQFFSISQTNSMKKCPEALAIAAMKDFGGSMVEYYGHRRPKLRSGF